MRETIFLIEDEVELQQNLKDILEFNGFSVLTADNGQNALLKIENKEVDVILFDNMMPVPDGYQFLKIIRNQERFQHLPFIFLSAKSLLVKWRWPSVIGASLTLCTYSRI